MKTYLLHLLVFASCIAYTAQNSCCPTCIGRLRPDSPPFFSDEHFNYQTNAENKNNAINTAVADQLPNEKESS